MRATTLFVALLISLPAAAVELFIPAVANGTGAAGSQWRTELVVRNPAADPFELRLSFLERGRDNTGVVPLALTLGPGTTRYADVLDELFGLSGAGGALSLEAAVDFEAEAAIFNEGSAAGRFGQGFRALDPARALAATGRSQGTILGLAENGDTRSNLYAVNPDEATSSFVVEFFDPFGALLSSHELSLPPRAAWLESVTSLSSAASGTLVVRIRTLEGSLLVGGSAIDRASGDPITHELLEPAVSVAGTWFGRLGEAFVDVLGGAEAIFDDSERLVSLDFSAAPTIDGCSIRFPGGSDDLDLSLTELADGADLVNGYSCFGCGDITWTLRLEASATQTLDGSISALGSDFFDDFSACNGTLGTWPLNLGRH